MSADYAIAQFRFLENLVLYHGFWSYARVARLVNYFFYKNIAFTLTQTWCAGRDGERQGEGPPLGSLRANALRRVRTCNKTPMGRAGFAFAPFPHRFQIYTGWSGQRIYDDWYQTLFNIVFTSMPVFIFCIFDKDIGSATVRAHPQVGRRPPARLVAASLACCATRGSTSPAPLGPRGWWVRLRRGRACTLLRIPVVQVYQRGPRRTLFTLSTFASWAIYGILHSLVLCLFLLRACNDVAVRPCKLRAPCHVESSWLA